MLRKTIECPKCGKKHPITGFLPSGTPGKNLVRFSCAKIDGGCGWKGLKEVASGRVSRPSQNKRGA